MTATAEGGERAWVLHRYLYRDTSLILELFTRESGRLGAVARGGRRPRSPFAALEAGRSLWVRWRGRGDLVTLLQAEEQGEVLDFTGMNGLILFYLNELLLRLIQRGDPLPELFDVYEQTLQSVALAGHQGWALRRFERRLLEILGWAPDLQVCYHCGRRLRGDDDGPWYYWPEHGVLCPDHRPASGTIAMPGGALAWLAGDMVEGPSLAWLPGLRRCLERELRGHLSARPLESHRLLAAYLTRAGQDHDQRSTG